MEEALYVLLPCAGLAVRLPDQSVRTRPQGAGRKTLSGAVDSLTKALAADPKDYSLHFNLALAYSLMGKKRGRDSGIQEDSGVQARPLSSRVESGNFAVARKASCRSGALSHRCSRAKAERVPAELLPRRGAAWHGRFRQGRAGLHCGAGDRSEVAGCRAWTGARAGQAGTSSTTPRRHFKKAAELNPSYRDDLLELAHMYETAKQPEQAMAIYQQFPDNPGAQERLGDAAAAGRASRPTPSRASRAAVAKSPTEANRAALAEAYLKNNEPDKALPVVEKILAARPERFRDPHAAWAHHSRSAQVSGGRRGV